MADAVHIQRRDARDFSSEEEYGVLITNPPYGERLGDKKEAQELYRVLGSIARKYPNWSYYVLTSDEEFETCFGKRADRKRKVYNGMIKCDYYQYYGPRPPKKESKD